MSDKSGYRNKTLDWLGFYYRVYKKVCKSTLLFQDMFGYRVTDLDASWQASIQHQLP